MDVAVHVAVPLPLISHNLFRTYLLTWEMVRRLFGIRKLIMLILESLLLLLPHYTLLTLAHQTLRESEGWSRKAPFFGRLFRLPFRRRRYVD